MTERAALDLIKAGFNSTAASVNAGSAALTPFSAAYQPLIARFNAVVDAQNALGPAIVAAIVALPPIVVPASGLTVTPSTIAGGSTVTINWSGVINPQSWVGLYKAGALDTTFIAYKYMLTQSEPFYVPDTLSGGAYEFRLFANNGFTILATSNPLTVSGSVKNLGPEIGRYSMRTGAVRMALR